MADKHYLVRWEIDAHENDPREAAEHVRARYFQLTGACIFYVRDAADRIGAKWRRVDLATGPEEDSDTWIHDHRALHRMAKQIHDEGGDVEEILYMLERPHKFADVLTRAVLDDAYDPVATGPEEIDHTVDDD